ncbi:3-ketoacyl-ACP reductase [Gordonibacter sp. 28C]|uniref:SDR family NAD(P)-dependent oxidoreductase n=1 Tax=Gordonibacter sp. 28C TaxID=2078569 RepID=UPI000DF7E442|nr:SDR family oxidoreductase [Gordonibacter sp. 28C]RDB62347.1 3-ketoacyl-ACP reductase [Gordonibacter sp. 28C]
MATAGLAGFLIDERKDDAVKSARTRGRLQGKVAIVTGAGNGMGCATAKLFADEGAHVVAVDVREDDLAQWHGARDVVPLVADVTLTEDVERLMAETKRRFGRLDALCNIAGINDLNYPLVDTDDERWDKVMDVDLKAPFRLCRCAVPLMIETGGSIVNIGSYAALRGNHGVSYTAAKAGLEGLTRSIAFEFMGKGIRCNIIHPGGTRTDIGIHSGGTYHADGKRLSSIVAAMPQGWFGDAEDIARACLFLCSDDADHINGAAISVDGGMCCC